MFNSLHIRNFRGFRDLEIGELGRINVLTGKNNAGKTSLLEAIYLLCGAGSPENAVNVNVSRGVASAGGAPASALETFWKPMFAQLDMARPVRIHGQHGSLGSLTLNIEFREKGSLALSFHDDAALAAELSAESSLLFRFKKNSEAEAVGRIDITSQGLHLERPTSVPPAQARFVSPRVKNFKDDAVQLGQLRKRKLGHFVLKALKVVDPRLQAVEDNSSSGSPLIWGDIGLPELVPLPMMGEGMVRIASLILAVGGAPGGVVLIDEIENGLHHSVLPKVWRSLNEAARQFNVQVFASTHSYECVQAALQSLERDCLALHRLEAINGQIRCVSYDPDASQAAMKHNLEVR